MASRPPAPSAAAAKDTTDDFAVGDEAAAPAPASVRSSAAQQQETDPRRLEQRQKQIDFGKNTRGYQRYAAAVPRDKRRFLHGGLVPIDPMTPDVRQACSKRAFDGQVRKWRRMLHEWDPEGEGEEAAAAGDGASAKPPPTATATAAKAGATTATTPGGGPLVSPGAKRNASNASRTPASAVHPRKQRARGGGGGGGGAKGEEEEDGERGAAPVAGAGIFADAVVVSADEAAAP